MLTRSYPPRLLTNSLTPQCSEERKKPTIEGWSAFRRMVRRCSLGWRFRSGGVLRCLVGRTRNHLGRCRGSYLHCGQDLFQPAEDFVVIYVFGAGVGAA